MEEHTVPPSPQDEADTPADDPEAAARTICLRLLDQRARSRGELTEALRRSGVPADAAARVLDRFGEVGLIDDAALAHTLASAQHRERGLAGRAVALKLRQRGLDDDVISRAVAGIDAGSERIRAGELVAARRKSVAVLPTPVQARRLVGMLARKGYPAGLAYAVVREALADEDPDPLGGPLD